MTKLPIIALCICGIGIALLLWTSAWHHKARQRAEAYCLDHQLVLVDTAAGERCAPLWALERTAR
jgi:hypothetical protein